jgi:energy-converting hydrogenase Eha subunit E
MNIGKLNKVLLWVQGSYTLLTALWGLIDIDSFMAVSGPKTDIWLVKTVSVVLAAIGLSLIVQALSNSLSLPILILALCNSIGLSFIDFYYSLRNVISKVYLADAFLEIVFFFIWIYILYRNKKFS